MISIPPVVSSADSIKRDTALGGRGIRAARALVGWVGSDRTLLFGVAMCVLLLLGVIFGPLAGLSDPQATSANVLQTPSLSHWLGTDSLGRDVLSRLVLGARSSLFVAVVATGIALIIGTAMGISAAYYGGGTDWAQMRLVDIMLSVPPLLMAIAVLATIGPSIPTLVLVLVLTHLPQTVRVVRASTLQVRQKAFVDSARISGIDSIPIMWTHVLPNVRGIIIVQASVMVAHMLLVETILSFLGLGVQPPTPSLGFMVSEGRQWMEFAPWVVLAPGVVIVFAVAAFTITGQGLDQRLARRR